MHRGSAGGQNRHGAGRGAAPPGWSTGWLNGTTLGCDTDGNLAGAGSDAPAIDATRIAIDAGARWPGNQDYNAGHRTMRARVETALARLKSYKIRATRTLALTASGTAYLHNITLAADPQTGRRHRLQRVTRHHSRLRAVLGQACQQCA